MSNPQTETKIERLTEATESLVLAIVAGVRMHGAVGDEAIRAFENVKDAREEYKTALREFTAPVLRVVQ